MGVFSHQIAIFHTSHLEFFALTILGLLGYTYFTKFIIFVYISF